jgi:pimeloyl-ACP methyl ester carboxylesterase
VRTQDRPPHLVFVPGLNNSAVVWQPVIDALPSGLSATAVDCPPLDDIDDVAKALLAEAPDSFVAVGHSFGGYVVLAMLAQQPERLRGVVLVNATDNADSPETASARLAMADAARVGDYEELAMGRVDLVYHPDHLADASTLEALLAARLVGVRGYGVERYIAHLRACSTRPDRGAVLAGSGVPVLVVAADHDPVVPTARQREMAERVGAEFRLVETAGHMLPAEQPAALAREIAAWVARL